MRRAYGAHRTMTPAEKARNVAESIRTHHLDTNDPTTWQRYGLEDRPDQRRLVRLHLALLEKIA